MMERRKSDGDQVEDAMVWSIDVCVHLVFYNLSLTGLVFIGDGEECEGMIGFS